MNLYDSQGCFLGPQNDAGPLRDQDTWGRWVSDILSETLKCWIFGISENTKQKHATKSIKNHNIRQKLNLLDKK